MSKRPVIRNLEVLWAVIALTSVVYSIPCDAMADENKQSAASEKSGAGCVNVRDRSDEKFLRAWSKNSTHYVELSLCAFPCLNPREMFLFFGTEKCRLMTFSVDGRSVELLTKSPQCGTWRVSCGTTEIRRFGPDDKF